MIKTVFRKKSQQIEDAHFEAVLSAAIMGDEQSLGKIFDAYFDMTYFFVYKRIGDREMSDDIVSEVWEKIYFHMKNMEQRDVVYFRNWVMRITKNKVIDYFRKTKEETQSITNYEYILDKQSPLIELLEKEDFQKIKNLLQNLPEKQSLCINMKYFHGMKNKEIAEKLNVGETTIASNLKRGLQKLKIALDEY